MRFLMVLSDFIIPVTVLFIVVFGSLKRVNLYETFLEGAKEGLHTVVNILPTLLGLWWQWKCSGQGDSWNF